MPGEIGRFEPLERCVRNRVPAPYRHGCASLSATSLVATVPAVAADEPTPSIACKPMYDWSYRYGAVGKGHQQRCRFETEKLPPEAPKAGRQVLPLTRIRRMGDLRVHHRSLFIRREASALANARQPFACYCAGAPLRGPPSLQASPFEVGRIGRASPTTAPFATAGRTVAQVQV